MKYKYRAKDSRIDAIQVNRNTKDELIDFCEGKVEKVEITRSPNGIMRVTIKEGDAVFKVCEGDYIAKINKNKLYSFEKNIFENTYEKDNSIVISDHLTDEDMDNVVEEAIDYMVEHLGYERK